MPSEIQPEVPRLSYSIAQTLITKTPLHAYSQHRLLGNKKKEETKAMDEGKLMEKFVLGAELEKLVIVEAKAWNTDKAKAARDEALGAGWQPVLRHVHDEAEAAAAILRKRFLDEGYDLAFVGDDRFKVSVQAKLLWESREGVLCSGVLDRLVLDTMKRKARIYDFKTTSDASDRKLQRSIFDLGYDIQQNSYEEAVGILYPEYLGNIETIFLFAETDEPYAVNPVRLAGNMSELGRRKWETAKESWKECMASGVWPGYARKDKRIEATAWQLATVLEADSLMGGDFEVVQKLEAV